MTDGDAAILLNPELDGIFQLGMRASAVGQL
jgi:hypothetical protein